MKKVVLFILLTLWTYSIYAQHYSSIKGKCFNENLKEVKLYQTIDGRCSLLTSTKVASDGSFGFLLVPETPGFYAIGDDRFHYAIYLKGGDNVSLNINDNDLTLSGDNTKENVMLYRWFDFSSKIRLSSVYFSKSNSSNHDFFSEFERYLSDLSQIQEKLKSGNKEFDEKLLELTKLETDYFACVYWLTPQSQYPSEAEKPNYYKHLLSSDKFVTDAVLDYPDGFQMLSTYLIYGSLSAKDMPRDPELYVKRNLSFIGHPRLKGEYLINSYFTRLKTYDEFLKGKQTYGKYFVTPSLKSRLESIGSKLYNSQVGMKAHDFSYPDINGNSVSLSDFKGKVVLVDVWATWCAPCKKEIPHLIKLEKEMEGTDLVVIGVSVDQAKDHQKWINFVKEKGLGGVQVHANGSKKIKEDYKITGIPRFMVFDKEGRVVTIDAPRPSNPDLKTLLETQLKK